MVWITAPGPPPESAKVAQAVPLTVLIVDDHPTFRASARLLLTAEGYEVVGEAGDGAAAIAAAGELAPDVILLDVQLPDLDGFEVARRVDAKVVLVSSRDEADYGPLVRDCGALGFIPKGELSGARLRELLT
jgi:DNA-binding NarL/FixJ family response regulator